MIEEKEIDLRTGKEENELIVEICWIRHGETKSNEEHRYLGKTDEPLSPDGREKVLQQKKENEEYRKESILFSSPLKRCVETAELLCDKAPDLLIPQWEEIDFGLFEGKNYEELKDDAKYQAWLESNGCAPFPSGESREEFIARCMEGFQIAIEKLREMAKKQSINKIEATAVVHGGTIMAILSSVTGKDYFDFQVKNGFGYKTTFRI